VLPFKSFGFSKKLLQSLQDRALKTGLPLPENQLADSLPIYLESNLAARTGFCCLQIAQCLRALTSFFPFFVPPLSTDSHVKVTIFKETTSARRHLCVALAKPKAN
jgi:hypothetical protein